MSDIETGPEFARREAREETVTGAEAYARQLASMRRIGDTMLHPVGERPAFQIDGMGFTDWLEKETMQQAGQQDPALFADDMRKA